MVENSRFFRGEFVRLSVPSVVLAEASWYGSLRAGWESNADGQAGVVDNGSRWGIKGSSEASEGLTAVYRFETKINSSNASSPGGRLSYVGLSGGFGTVTIGQVWSASYNHFGGVVDQGHKFSDSETTFRPSNTISYAVNVGSVSFQADISGNPGGGWSETVSGDTATAEDKDIDASQFGATMALGENGKIALAHINDDGHKDTSKKRSYVAGEYTVGGMTMWLGFAQAKAKDDRSYAPTDTAGSITLAAGKSYDEERKDKTTFYGIRGGLGDTGASFALVARSKKATGDRVTNVDGTLTDGDTPANKHSPWLLSLSRSLGGGASVHLEHANPDMDKEKSSTYLGLKVDF